MRSILPRDILKPAVLVETRNFVVKLAENHGEVEDAQRLRYEVFNLEQGRGLEGAEKYGMDFDEFDEYCLHLLVINKAKDKIVGTYRAHLGSVANSGKGFYSSREYDIKKLYRIADRCLELGRSCVSPEFRTGAAVALLWKAITELLKRADLKYMLGCVSLEKADPKLGWALYEYFKDEGLMCPDIKAVPRPGFALAKPPRKEIEKLLSNKERLREAIPPIFKGYLRIGTRICGEPAFDRDFGTIDFFIMFDLDSAPDRYVRHFKLGK